MRMEIKPLSVNNCWQGRRFKTKEYKQYEKDLLFMLPDMEIPEGDLEMEITWGFSSAASDVDNPSKPFIDILQKRYGFNDRRITKLILKKERVKKGREYVDYEIKELKSERETSKGVANNTPVYPELSDPGIQASIPRGDG